MLNYGLSLYRTNAVAVSSRTHTHLTDHLKTSTPLPKGRFTLRPEASEIWASDGLSSFI